MLQQALHQQLSPIFEKDFQRHSYGFRPNHNAHQAVTQALENINEGYQDIVDIDLKSFFDEVSHELLMTLIYRRVKCPLTLKLIRKFLRSPISINGKLVKRRKGVPQGSPLSPLLSNIILNELDKELEKRGHRYVRYADDFSIYFRSKAAARRVGNSIYKFLKIKLRLPINREESGIRRPSKFYMLGYGFVPVFKKGVKGKYQLVTDRSALRRLKEKIKSITRKTIPASFDERVTKLNQVLRGWINYFKLANMYGKLRDIDVWVRRRLRRCLWQPGISPGMDISVRSMIVNRSEIPLKINKYKLSYLSETIELNEFLKTNEQFYIKKIVHIPENTPYSQPYWLEFPNDGKMFTIKNNKFIEIPESPSALSANFFISIDDLLLEYEIPVIHRWNDVVKGEQKRPFIIKPELSISLERPTYIFAESKSQKIFVNVTAHNDSLKGIVELEIPVGWKSDTYSMPFILNEEGEKEQITFQISPEEKAKSDALKVIAKIENKEFFHEIIEIEHDHILPQTVLLPSIAKLVKLDVQIVPRRIGYIMGSGDEIPESLEQLGYEITLLSDEDIDNLDLSQFAVLICGIRAFNVRNNLDRQQKKIIKFVEEGGTWIVQHNTRFGNQVQQIGPYPFTASGRDRVSEEKAEMQILVPDHSIFTYPNIITQRDFDGWIQERGLYFADRWQGKLYPLVACKDNGEPSKLGGLLYAKYGKGVFIYTAYSWFRQLPASVPGAIRLFVNLISAKGNI